MSHGIYGCIVPLDALRGAVGSKRKELVATVKRGRADEWREIDELDDTGKQPKMRQVVEALIMGRETPRSAWYLHTYAVQAICETLGRRAGERRVRGENWLEQVTATMLGHLHRAYVAAGIIDVLWVLNGPQRRSKQVPISFANKDWPYAAIVSPEECNRARESIEANVGKLDNAWIGTTLQLHSWLGEVGFDDGLALFYY